MYITSVLDNYRLEEVKENKALREKLDNMSTEELINLLMSYTFFHNHTDTCDRERLIRAIEIQDYYKTILKIETNIVSAFDFLYSLRKR